MAAFDKKIAKIKDNGKRTNIRNKEKIKKKKIKKIKRKKNGRIIGI